MGGDSCSEVCGFKSHHRILDGHFSRIFVIKIVMFVRKDKNKTKKRTEIALIKTFRILGRKTENEPSQSVPTFNALPS